MAGSEIDDDALNPRPSAAHNTVERQIEGVALLRDPVRRRLYDYVGLAGEVSRDQAAHEVGIRRALAAFHLDRLVAEGLLDIEYRRLSGKTGPGAGRPAKLYRRSERQLEVTLPARRYELAARLFADALDQPDGRDPRQRLSESARDLGRSIGAQSRLAAGREDGERAEGESQAALERAIEVISDYGFEPYQENGVVYLRNCPFHALAQDHRELVCGMNLAMLEGLISGLDTDNVDPRLEPAPGRCCVTLHPAR